MLRIYLADIFICHVVKETSKEQGDQQNWNLKINNLIGIAWSGDDFLNQTVHEDSTLEVFSKMKAGRGWVQEIKYLLVVNLQEGNSAHTFKAFSLLQTKTTLREIVQNFDQNEAVTEKLDEQKQFYAYNSSQFS